MGIRALFVLLVALAGIAATGCVNMPKPQSYSVTLAASGGNVTQTGAVSLTVLQSAPFAVRPIAQRIPSECPHALRRCCGHCRGRPGRCGEWCSSSIAHPEQHERQAAYVIDLVNIYGYLYTTKLLLKYTLPSCKLYLQETLATQAAAPGQYQDKSPPALESRPHRLSACLPRRR